MGRIATKLVEVKRDERGRRITPVREREALVRAYEQSGLTQKAFAKREGVKYPTFVSWVQECRRHRTEPKARFAEFTVAASASLEVQLPDGRVIRGGRAEDVARLLELLRC